MQQTISEKIFSAHVGRPVRAGEVVVSPLDLVFWDDSNRPQACQVFREMGGKSVFDASRIAAFLDHAAITHNLAMASTHKTMRDFCAEQGIRLYEIGEGIEHQLIPEKGLAGPGDIIIGADSHTCTIGALNAFGAGVGSSDLATGLLTGKLWFRVPKTVRFVLDGRLQPGVFSKDIVLALLKRMGADGANYEAVEFVGSAMQDLSMESRFVITNMAVEMGAKTGLMEIDDRAREWMKGRVERGYRTYTSDPGAETSREIRIDVSSLEPQVAKPHSPANGVPVGEIAGLPIQQAVIGTCTNGRLEDLREAAQVLRGRKVAPGVRLYVTPSSRTVLQDALKEGLIATFIEAGAVLGTPGCGGCTGGSGLGIPGDGVNMISTANRNFKGRTGNNNAFIYLASPATVMASAVEGRIADPRKYP
ncbi:MAG TPA: 3-isopropylmalate dehydratase large subunit [Usitatibacter sp.]|nr:3-isopropylmalate dehydratase large subunit [Usitatibacter sp.]